MTLSKRGFSSRFVRARADRRAQMPFSMIAVLLLVISSASVALVYGLDSLKESARIPTERLEDLKTAMDDAVDDVVRIAYSSAVESVRGTGKLNASELQERYLAALTSSLNAAYPSRSGDILVSVAPALSLDFLLASLQESYSAHGDDLASWNGASVPAYFVINGNFSLEVACPEGKLTRTVEMEQDVHVPLPLLLYKLDRLSGASAPRGEIESIVRYELAALAQDRVLRGYGSSARSGTYGTEVIITAEDVVRAVNLAVTLEEMRYFQDIGAIDDDLEGISPLLMGLHGEVDPADLFLRSYQEGGIDLATVVGQALYARADAIVLKWLDYLGLIDLVGMGEDLAELGEVTLNGVLDLLTGGDHDQSSMVQYISAALAEAGFQEYDYRWYCFGGGDILVDLPALRIQLFDDLDRSVMHTFQGRYAVDLPGVDVFSSPAWGELYGKYRSETYAVAEGMRSYIRTIASGIAAHCSLPSVVLELDPADGRTYLEEIDRQLSAAFRDGASWLTPALDRVNEMGKVRDGLAQAVMDHMADHWMEILDVDRSIEQGGWDLANQLVQELADLPNFSEASLAEARQSIQATLVGDYRGVKEIFYEQVRVRAGDVLNRFEEGLSQKYTDVDPMTSFLAGGLSSLPGLGPLTARAVRDTLNGYGAGLEAQGGAVQVPVYTGGSLVTLNDGRQRSESFSIDSSVLRLSQDGSGGSLDVRVTLPWQFDRSNTSYPNRHVTDLGGMSSTPYLTQWNVVYEGDIAVTARSAGDRFDIPCSTVLNLRGSLDIVAFSGWALRGVDYFPTATLAGDVQKLLAGIYDFLSSAVQAIGGLANDLFVLLCRFLGDMLSCSTSSVSSLESIIASSGDALAGMVTGSISEVIGALADASTTILGGTTVDLRVLGAEIKVVFAPQDSALVGTEDRLRLDIVQSCAGATMLSTLRVLKLNTGEHTLAAAVSLGGGDWSVDLTLDPLAMVYPHQVEIRGFLGGHILEMYAPEVERVQKVSLSLSDVPGLGIILNSIPSPIPGTKWNVDAGMEMSFNVLERRTVLINEVELNPKGTDRSREWVEIYNPGDRAVDLAGWSLATSRGQQHREMLTGVVPSHGYLVHRFTGQALDNGEVKGFPLQESVALLDREGKRVDSAPWMKDLADDDRTWQRSFDGSSRWELRDDTRGRSNGFVLLDEDDLDGLTTLVGECFLEAFHEVVTTLPDMETLKEIIVGGMHKLEDRLLDEVERKVSSLRFYIVLGLDDLTGTAGGSISAALVYDGKAVRDCLAWFIDAIGEVLRDPLNPMAAGARAPVPMQTLADHVFVEVGAYLRIGTPDLISMAVDSNIKIMATIKASLGTLGMIDGGSVTEVKFGVLVSGVMGAMLKTGTGQSAGSCYDVWLIRGSLRAA
ncbi:MAG: lamin tail domain-containing protein [Methanomassiliicoccus sp.]|nr:lamin tail domain-containing protein [Methanomassiliicoccus sp.]